MHVHNYSQRHSGICLMRCTLSLTNYKAQYNTASVSIINLSFTADGKRGEGGREQEKERGKEEGQRYQEDRGREREVKKGREREKRRREQTQGKKAICPQVFLSDEGPSCFLSFPFLLFFLNIYLPIYQYYPYICLSLHLFPLFIFPRQSFSFFLTCPLLNHFLSFFIFSCFMYLFKFSLSVEQLKMKTMCSFIF